MDMVLIMAADGAARDVQLSTSKRRDGHGWADGRGMVPVKRAGELVSVHVELSGKWQIQILLGLVLMTENMKKSGLDVKKSGGGKNGFDEVPVGSEGGVAVVLLV